MKQHMPDTHGEVDLGPLVLTTMDLYPRLSGVPEAGPVRTRRIVHDEVIHDVRPPYAAGEVQEIVAKGRKEPRRLSLAEERVRDHNKAIARGDYSAAETAHADDRDTDPGSRMQQRYPTGTRNYGHSPRRTAW